MFVSAPSGPVQNLIAMPTSSSVMLQWDRVPCMDRNSPITGYEVIFGATFTSTRTTESISGTETRTFNTSGLIPRTEYTFKVSPLSDSQSDKRQFATVAIETTLPSGKSHHLIHLAILLWLYLSTEVTLQLKGQFYSSHSVLDPVVIKTGTNSLLCITTIEACCQGTHTGTGTVAGQWYFPDGTRVPEGALNPHYLTRGASVVKLNRGSSAATTSGLYRCEVPVADGTESVYIGLYPVGEGW